MVGYAGRLVSACLAPAQRSRSATAGRNLQRLQLSGAAGPPSHRLGPELRLAAGLAGGRRAADPRCPGRPGAQPAGAVATLALTGS